MRKGLYLLLAAWLSVTFAIPQATVNQFYAWAAVKGDASTAYVVMQVDAPLFLTRDPSGRLHLTAAGGAAKSGTGILLATGIGIPTTISIDTSVIPYRVPPPAGPGPCTDPVSGIALGSAAEAVDEQGNFYFCAADVWHRIPPWSPRPALL